MIKIRKKRVKGGFSIYLDIYKSGIRSYEFLNLRLGKNRELNKEILSKAETIRAQRELEMQSDEYGLIPSFKKRINIIDFMNENCNMNLPIYRALLMHLKKFKGAVIPFKSVNLSFLNEFRKYLIEKNFNSNYINVLLSNFKTVIYKAKKKKIVTNNVFEGFEMLKKTKTIKDFLTLDEIKKLVNTKCTNKEVKRAFLFACYTGLRISDIKRLQFKDIQNNEIRIVQKKTNNILTLPIPEPVKKLLFPDENVLNMLENFVFDLPENNSAINYYIKDWIKRAGIKKNISFHSSRHSAAVLLLSLGVDLYTVSKILGHTSIKTTEVYSKLIPEKYKEALNRIPDVINGN